MPAGGPAPGGGRGRPYLAPGGLQLARPAGKRVGTHSLALLGKEQTAGLVFSRTEAAGVALELDPEGEIALDLCSETNSVH